MGRKSGAAERELLFLFTKIISKWKPVLPHACPPSTLSTGEGLYLVSPNLSFFSLHRHLSAPHSWPLLSTPQGPGTQQACLWDQQGSLRRLQAVRTLCHALRLQRCLQPLLQAAPRSQMRGRGNHRSAPEPRFVSPCSSNTEVHRHIRIACFLHDLSSGCAAPSCPQVERNERTVLRNVFIYNKILVWYFHFENSVSSGKRLRKCNHSRPHWKSEVMLNLCVLWRGGITTWKLEFTSFVSHLSCI